MVPQPFLYILLMLAIAGVLDYYPPVSCLRILLLFRASACSCYAQIHPLHRIQDFHDFQMELNVLLCLFLSLY